MFLKIGIYNEWTQVMSYIYDCFSTALHIHEKRAYEATSGGSEERSIISTLFDKNLCWKIFETTCPNYSHEYFY